MDAAARAGDAAGVIELDTAFHMASSARAACAPWSRSCSG